MPRGSMERGWGGTKGQRKMIEEGLAAFDGEQKEKNEIHKKISELQDEITAYSQASDDYVDYHRMFKDVEKMWNLAKDWLSPTELKQLVAPLYTFFEQRYHDLNNDDNESVNAVQSFNNFEKLYRLTGIDPADGFATNDINTQAGLYNVVTNPQRILFNRAKDDPELLKKYTKQQYLLVGSRAIREAVGEGVSLAEIEAACHNILKNARLYLEDRLSQVGRLKKAFPEMHFTVDVKTAQKFYEEIIADAIAQPGSYERISEGVVAVGEATGVPPSSIQFDVAMVKAWYAQLIPKWIEFSKQYNSFDCSLVVQTLEEITKVSPDFSVYADDIKEMYNKQLESLEEDIEKDSQLENINPYWLKSLAFHDKVEKISRFTGVPPVFDARHLQELEQQDLNTHVNGFIYNVEHTNKLGNSAACSELRVRSGLIEKMQHVFGVRAEVSILQAKKIYEKFLAVLDKPIYESQSRDPAYDIVEEYVTMAELLTGKNVTKWFHSSFRSCSTKF